MLLHKRSISVHLISSLKSPVFSLLRFLWILQHVRGKKLDFGSALKESLQSFSFIFSKMSLFFQVGYSHIKFLQLVPSKLSSFPTPTLQIYLYHRAFQRSYNRVPTFSALHSEVRKSQKMMGSLCSMVDFNNSNSYKSFSTVFNLLNNGS